MVWTAIGAIGSSLLGGLFGSSGAKKQNQAQIQAAREQMDFQERMSNTAHVREVADLKNAGLNPILSAKLGGASSPAGAQPNIVNEMAPLENSARAMGDKLYNFKVQTAQVDNMRLQNDLLKEQVKAQQISNARQGLFDSAYEVGGKVVDKIASGVDGLIGKGPDILQEVMDANSSEPYLPPVPTGYRLAEELSKYTRGSEAGKYYRGEKGFWESFRDAQRNAVEYNKEKRHRDISAKALEEERRLTPEKLRRYGIENLQQIYRRAGR